MSDNLTAHEARLCRDAYLKGVADLATRYGICEPLVVAESRAAELYPIPQREEPRIEPDPHSGGLYWLVRNGEALPCDKEGTLLADLSRQRTPERVALWADLLARPTVRVDE